MHYLDITLLLIFAFAGLKGFLRGFIIEIFSLVGFFLGIFLAIKLAPVLTVRFFDDSNYSGLISLALFFFIFVVITILTNLVARLVSKGIRLVHMGIFDKILGSIFAILKWGLLASLFIWLAESIQIIDGESYRRKSYIYAQVSAFGPFVFEKIGQLLPMFNEVFEFIDEYDEKDKLVYTLST